MSRRGFVWALGVVAPWCLGMGLLVSFTADAGQDMSIGATMAPRTTGAAGEPIDLVPGIQSTLRSNFRLADCRAIRWAVPQA